MVLEVTKKFHLVRRSSDNDIELVWGREAQFLRDDDSDEQTPACFMQQAPPNRFRPEKGSNQTQIRLLSSLFLLSLKPIV